MRKLLCVLLTITLAVSMTIGASASLTGTGTIITGNTGTGTVITGNTGPTTPTVVTTGIRGINTSSDIYSLASFNVTVNNSKNNTLSLDDLSDLEVAPGDVLRIPIPGNLFLDANGDPFKSANVSLSALSSGRIGVKESITRGAGSYTASLVGNRNGSYIEIEFSDGIFLTAQRFTSGLYLTRNGARATSTRIDISGVLQTPTRELEWGDDYADLSDGSAIYARTAVRNAELYLGDYCTITRNLARGVRYAGVATTGDINEKDVAILQKHPSIQYIYKLKTVSLKTTGNIVTFDLGTKYHVYDANGIYIGTSDKALPYWTKYYLSTKKYESIKVK